MNQKVKEIWPGMPLMRFEYEISRNAFSVHSFLLANINRMNDEAIKKVLHLNESMSRMRLAAMLPSRSITPEIELLLLTDDINIVRRAYAMREDWVPTEAQLKSGLNDVDGHVRWVYENRKESDWARALLARSINLQGVMDDSIKNTSSPAL